MKGRKGKDEEGARRREGVEEMKREGEGALGFPLDFLDRVSPAPHPLLGGRAVAV